MSNHIDNIQLKVQAESPFNDGWTSKAYQDELGKVLSDVNEATVTEHSESNAATFRDTISEVNPEAMIADGFDDAIVGYDSNGCVIYSYDKCMKVLQERDGMSNEEAHEYMEFNVVNAYVGDFTTVFMHSFFVIGE